MIQINSFLRSSIGFATAIIPSNWRKRERVYINLRGVNQVGGPDRFLRNFSKALEEKGIAISNWSLSGCAAALVFSASWGDSFAWLCRQLGVRSVLRVDGFYVPAFYGPGKKHPLTDYQRWVNERLTADLERFDHVIYQSSFSKQQADLYLYRRRKAYSIVYNGVDTQFFNAKRATKQSRYPTLITLGKHYPEHLTLALDVFKRVRATQYAKLLIVGPMRDGTEGVANFVAQYLKGSPLQKDIECFGTVSYENLPNTLAQADIFLHVKVGDWCPNAVLEALASGLPVVCPAWGGTKELIGQGGIAVVGPQWDVDDNLRDGMAKAVLQLWARIDDYSSLAFKIAQERYDYRFVAGAYLSIMRLGRATE